jgi:CheY-like chemotaxis protein
MSDFPWFLFVGTIQMMRKVIIADPNTSFATVIADALAQMGAYTVTLAASGQEAQQFCAELKPDLVVVDVDLPDCQPADLIGQLRATVPGLPVVLIPYRVDDVPAGLDIQGILTKPFFLPDLPALVEGILGATPESPTPPPAETPKGSLPRAAKISKPVVINENNLPEVQAQIKALSEAVRNEPVLLVHGKKVIAIEPPLAEAASATLTESVAKAWHARGTSTEVIRFEGNSETTRYMLYSSAVADDLVLSLALRVRIPLLTVRKLVREAISKLEGVVTQG